MTIVRTVARILLGLLFVAAGVDGSHLAPFVVAARLVVIAWPNRALFAPLFIAQPVRRSNAR